MSRQILPRQLRERITHLFLNGHSSAEIYDLIIEDAREHVSSHDQLSKCITSIISRGNDSGLRQTMRARQVVPEPKAFDHFKYVNLIDQLSATMQEKEFEHSCEGIVEDILMNYEGFENLMNANRADGFANPPFDFMGMKNGDWYIIEFKGSLHSFNAPGEAQKRRMRELLERIEDLKVALLQVKLNNGEYRIFYDNEVDLFFNGLQMSLDPVEKWVRAQIGNWKQ